MTFYEKRSEIKMFIYQRHSVNYRALRSECDIKNKAHIFSPARDITAYESGIR